MSKIQEHNGQHVLTVPKDILDGKQWKKGNEIGFVIVDDINRPVPGDIFLRKNR